MKQPIFTGSGVAIVTPFKHDAIDFDAFGRLIDFQIDAGTDAIIVCGTTGEASTLTYRERMRVIEYCVERVAGRVPVIAGSGSNHTESAVSLSRDTESTGVDALLIVTPYYNKASQTGLVRHYNAIADAVTAPIILYNVPGRTGVSFTAETYRKLSNHPNILGVKEASGSFALIQDTRSRCPEDFYLWSGNDEDTAAICALGGKGVISVAANIVPSQMHELTRLCLANDLLAAGALQLQLTELIRALFCEVNPIPVKTALGLMGLCENTLRLPLCEMHPLNAEKLAAVLEKYALLPA